MLLLLCQLILSRFYAWLALVTEAPSRRPVDQYRFIEPDTRGAEPNPRIRVAMNKARSGHLNNAKHLLRSAGFATGSDEEVLSLLQNLFPDSKHLRADWEALR